MTFRARRFALAASIATALWLGSASSMADLTKDQCVDANSKGQDLRRDGKLSAAREQLRQCASPSCPAMVRDDCTKRLDELESAQPSLVFETKDAAGNDLSAVKVTMDGNVLAERLEGTALPVDPGEHTFTFEGAGQPRVEKRLVIHEGDKGRRERVQMGTAAEVPPLASTPPVSATTPPPVATPPPETQAATRSPSSGLGARRVAGMTLGGVGVVGVGVGSVLGLLASSAWSRVKSTCGPGGPGNCTTNNPAAAMSDHKTAETDGTISTVAFIAGGALVATGVVVFLTRGHQGQEQSPAPRVAVTPSFGPSQAGVALSGTF